MNANKQNLTKYIAGILFLLPIMDRLNPSQLLWLMEGNSLWSLLQVCGNLILAISMVIQSKKLFRIGAIFGVGSSFLRIVSFIRAAYIFTFASNICSAISISLWLISSVLLLLSSLQSEKAKLYSVISAGSYIIHVFFNYIVRPFGFMWLIQCALDGSLISYFETKLGNILGTEFWEILSAIAILLSYYVMNRTEFSFNNLRITVTSTSRSNVNADNLTENLTRLKELLDMNIITQEEFDAKKKELLNL